MSSGSNRLLFSYETSNVYAQDLASLRPSAWLNDNIIAFYMDYLQHSVFAQHSDKLRFVSPGTSFILMHEDDPSDLADSFEGCDVTPETELVFFPLNNNVNVTKMGGSHWTLLVLDVTTRSFYSFDSMSSSRAPSAEAKKLSTNLTPILDRLATATNDASTTSSKTNVRLSSPPAPQQTNTSDCGVFALAIAESIADARINHRGLANAAIDGENMQAHIKKTVTAKDVAKKRGDILEIIRKHQS